MNREDANIQLSHTTLFLSQYFLSLSLSLLLVSEISNAYFFLSDTLSKFTLNTMLVNIGLGLHLPTLDLSFIKCVHPKQNIILSRKQKQHTTGKGRDQMSKLTVGLLVLRGSIVFQCAMCLIGHPLESPVSNRLVINENIHSNIVPSLLLGVVFPCLP